MQKAGTTWLHSNLRNHPEIWLPPRKEIHFFDAPHPGPPWFHLWHISPTDRYVARHHLKCAMRTLRTVWRSRRLDADASWMLRYTLAPRTLRLYASLFHPAAHQIAGEITPRYSLLPLDVIAQVHRAMPALRLILLIRNPAHRLWSHFGMFCRRKGVRSWQQASPELRCFLLASLPRRLSAICTIIEHWQTLYPPEQIFLGYFDDITQRSFELLDAVTDFLGVERNRTFFCESAEQRVFAGQMAPPPAEVDVWLAHSLLPEFRAAHARLNSALTAAWLADAERKAGLAPSTESLFPPDVVARALPRLEATIL
jgi:hypothetical protein